MTTPKRPARTPAQRRADLRARAVTLLMDDDAALLRAADGVVLEALLHAFRRRLTHDFASLSAELLRRMESARVTVTQQTAAEVEPENVTVTLSTDSALHTCASEDVTVTSRTYSTEVRRMALELADAGRTSREIAAAIMQRVGKAPDVSNIAKMIRSWRAAIE